MSKMPVLFIGHGSPMNAIEDNVFSRNWIEIAKIIPKPTSVLSISAHWTTHGTRVADSLQPKTIYDMFGFPPELYEVQYQPAGSPELARSVQKLITVAQIDNSWGIDHGTWSVLKWMYPEADVPVVQLGISQNESRQYHFELGQALKNLREQGVLILGSGNVVHNLALVNWAMTGAGYDWAEEFDAYIKDKVINRRHQDVLDYHKASKSAERAFFTTEHFDPLLYVLGASESTDQISIYNNFCVMGSLSMTSYLFG